jgi:UDP-3-O-[3-hydroxymyristoyl] glucosamine N-acyltransferase
MAFLEKSRGCAPSDTRASAIWCRKADLARIPVGVAAVVTPTPRGSFSKAAFRLFSLRVHPADAPSLHPHASIATDVSLSPGVVIGPDATIGSGTTIGPNSVIGPGVSIGTHCSIGANVSIFCAIIGHRVKISSGCVIGEAGFGVAASSTGPVDVPQFGKVVLHDDVSLGALCSVDRGAFGDTVIGPTSKIDNFCQIAHNVQIGRGVIIAAFGGISGSTIIGDFVQMGGRVGLADHLTVGAGARIGASSGVRKNIPAGETWVGYPAVPLLEYGKCLATLRRLAKPQRQQKGSHKE